MNYYWTADTHFGHGNIIKYCNRPFSSLQEMDLSIIRNWNAKVKKDDTVFLVGDFNFCQSGEAPDAPKKSYEYYKSQLNGNIIFLRGSHDKQNKVKTIIRSISILYGGYSIYITHDPRHANPNYQLNFVGHVHNKWKFSNLSKKSDLINIGVDVWDFKPVNINEILLHYKRWKKGEK